MPLNNILCLMELEWSCDTVEEEEAQGSGRDIILMAKGEG